MAAQTAKQVIIQRLREAERENIFAEFKEKEGSIVTAVIQRREGRMVYLDIGHTLAVMNQDGQVMSEKYTSGQRLRVFIVSVEMTPKGPEILVSRTHSDLVKELFKSEVPEISSGIVEIKAIAREAGMRSKIAVSSNQDTIDPVGSCVGQRGTRVQTIITELGGEKIDIIEWHKNPEKFITNALSPAKVESLKLNEKEKTVLVNVKDDQLSLAIGKSGQNVRLAAKLTEWKIDIEGAENIAKEESKEEVEDDKKEKKLDKEEKPVKEKKVKAKTKAKDKKETKPKKKKAAPKKDKK